MLKPHQISIETGELKNKLRSAYEQLRARGQSPMTVKHFEDLWDIKEKALLEKQQCVTVPSGWLMHLEEHVKEPKLTH